MTRHKTVSKVLELRGFTKEQLEFEAKKTKDELTIEKASLDQLENTLRDAVAKFNKKQNNSLVSTQDLGFFYDYFSDLNRQTEEQKRTVHMKLSELEEKQKAILEAHKEKRLFEILHDKLLHEEMRETLLAEQKTMDFNFIARKSRR